jgi:hypothetical protein
MQILYIKDLGQTLLVLTRITHILFKESNQQKSVYLKTVLKMPFMNQSILIQMNTQFLIDGAFYYPSQFHIYFIHKFF